MREREYSTVTVMRHASLSDPSLLPPAQSLQTRFTRLPKRRKGTFSPLFYVQLSSGGNAIAILSFTSLSLHVMFFKDIFKIKSKKETPSFLSLVFHPFIFVCLLIIFYKSPRILKAGSCTGTAEGSWKYPLLHFKSSHL